VERDAIGRGLLLDVEEGDVARGAVEAGPDLEAAGAGVGPLLRGLQLIVLGRMVEREELGSG